MEDTADSTAITCRALSRLALAWWQFVTPYYVVIAFTELQTDMTEMTADIAALHGLPFYDYREYSMKVLFPMQSEYDHPVLRKLSVSQSPLLSLTILTGKFCF